MTAAASGVSVTADAERLAAIHAESFPDPWSEMFFASLLRQPGITALGAPGDDPRGFIMVRQAVDEAEILTIAVAPAHRRRGYGRILLDGAIVLLSASGAARCFLEVAADNTAAIALYDAAGFRRINVRKNYYQGRVDALLMDVALPTPP